MNTNSVTKVTKTKEKSNKQKGDEGEKFAYSVMTTIRYITEIHPRTFRPVYLPNGKKIMVAQDNDYHNSFDLKGEREDGMLYSQVKWHPSGSINGGHIADAKRTIDRNYPYYFPYQKIQIWMVWKEWVKRPGERRHKEFFFRVWQRGEPIEYNENGYHFFKWIWKEIDDGWEREEVPIGETQPSKYHEGLTSECNITSELKEQPQIVLKLSKDKNEKVVK
ncbi:MAG: hypothetical protein RE472_09945 [Thermoplasmatales archaeon]|nr:MAG: hypothetical protein RE472_09945 [Thermoplasmatales archaeon]